MPYFVTLEDEDGTLMSVPEMFDFRFEVKDFIKNNRADVPAGCDYYVYESSGGVILDNL